MIARWEARSARRWGSEHRGWFESQDEALSFARAEIASHGNEGRIDLNDAQNRIIYFDVHPEMS